MNAAAIAFFILGGVFVIFSRQVTALFRWLDKVVWNKEARSRYPHLAPRGDPPRSVAIVLGLSWIACAVFLWFVGRR